MSNLYQISERQRNLLDLLLSGEVEEDVLAPALAEVEKELSCKAADCIAVMLKMDSFIGEVDNEVRRLTDYKKSLKANQDRLKNTIVGAMVKLGRDSLPTGRGVIKLKTNPAACVIDNIDILPTEYTKTEIKITPDKTKIKDAIKSGTLVAGAHLEQTQRVEVK